MTKPGMKRLHGMLFGVISLALVPPILAAEPMSRGTFSAATEADWGAAFELKDSGVVVVTPHFEDDPDAKPRKVRRAKTITGTWREADGGIELMFGKFKDRFVLQNPCRDWKDYPCFRYQKSLVSTKQKSPLNLNYAYINWDWKAKK